MRILVAHNEYQQAGGEDRVVEREVALLSAAGYDVRRFTASNHSIQGTFKKIAVALEVSYSRSAKGQFAEVLKREQPDVVHVHNFFPLMTPSVFDACTEAGIPVVHTLHNYRLICPGALLVRDSQVCEKCVGGSTLPAVLHGCYRESAAATIPVAWMTSRHLSQGTWHRCVDRFIALSEFARAKFIEGGFPAERITVKAHSTADPGDFDKTANSRPIVLFAGRLSPEKGILSLLKAWRSLNPDAELRITGDGPLRGRVEEMAQGSRIQVLGPRNAQELSAEMRRADLLVAPSECYETFGLVAIEAFAHSTPALVPAFGSLAELVEDGQTGLHFTPFSQESLAQKLQALLSDSERMKQMGKTARSVFLQRFTPEKNLEKLVDLYRSVIREHR